MKKKRTSIPAVLTIAGSNSGGGAGIQADLKTFSALNVFGASAITCVTAQNPDALTGIAEINSAMIIRQIRAVCDGFPVAAAKIGMLYSIPIILAVAHEPSLRKIPCLVVDPVMVSTSGAPLLRADAIRTLGDRLLSMATIITPNIDEAAILCGRPIDNLKAQEEAARELTQRFDAAAVVKGGHFNGKTMVDVLFAKGKIHRFALPRIAVHETHGTGCVFSAALTAFLARGESVVKAVEHAKRFVHESLKHVTNVGRHYPLNISAVRAKSAL